LESWKELSFSTDLKEVGEAKKRLRSIDTLQQSRNQLIFLGKGQNDYNLLYLKTKHVFQNVGGASNCPVAPSGCGPALK